MVDQVLCDLWAFYFISKVKMYLLVVQQLSATTKALQHIPEKFHHSYHARTKFFKQHRESLWYADATLKGKAFGVSENIYEMIDQTSEFNLQKENERPFLAMKMLPVVTHWAYFLITLLRGRQNCSRLNSL